MEYISNHYSVFKYDRYLYLLLVPFVIMVSLIVVLIECSVELSVFCPYWCIVLVL